MEHVSMESSSMPRTSCKWIEKSDEAFCHLYFVWPDNCRGLVVIESYAGEKKCRWKIYKEIYKEIMNDKWQMIKQPVVAFCLYKAKIDAERYLEEHGISCGG